jgi:hypothetical protein
MQPNPLFQPTAFGGGWTPTFDVSMPSSRVAALLFAIAMCGSALGQWSATPEAAFAEYQQASRARDIPRFLASIEFRQEAIEQLRQDSVQANPPESSVAERAASREAKLRSHLESQGFKPATIDTCEIVNKWQDTPDQVRFPVVCSGPNGSLSFAVRVMRFPHGWRVVRGRWADF